MNGKRCVKCGQVKSETEFYLRQVGGTERINRCRDCDNSKPRTRNIAKLVRVRARHRATAELVRRHDGEFRALLDEYTALCGDEAAEIETAAKKEHGLAEARLRPGIRRPGQVVSARIDTTRCPHCVKHHERFHVCPRCGARPPSMNPARMAVGGSR